MLYEKILRAISASTCTSQAFYLSSTGCGIISQGRVGWKERISIGRIVIGRDERHFLHPYTQLFSHVIDGHSMLALLNLFSIFRASATGGDITCPQTGFPAPYK